MNLLTRFMLDTIRAFVADEAGEFPSRRVRGTHITPTDPDLGSDNVSISVRKLQALVAPCSAWLQADVVDFGVEVRPSGYDPSAHDIEYLWSVELLGDPGYALEEYDAPLHVAAEHMVKGTKWNKRICHVMERGGTYRYTVTAINLDTGESATSAPYDIEVAHPDDFFAPSETFVVDPAGTGAGGPATSNPIYTSIAAAQAACEAASSANRRICVKAGTYASGLSLSFEDATLEVFVGDTYGTGKAIFQTNGIRISDPEAINWWSCALKDWVMQGAYDRTTDLYVGEGGISVRGDLPFERMFTYWGVDALDNGVWEYNIAGGPRWTAFANSIADNLRQFAHLGGGQELGRAYLGCRVTNHPEQAADEGDLTGYCIRSQGGSWFYLTDQCDMFNRRGWYPNAPSIGPCQACIRHDMFVDDQHFIVSRCTMEGNIKGDFGSGTQYPPDGNTIIERNYCLGSRDTGPFWSFQQAGVTFRNNICVRPPSKSGTNIENSTFRTERFLNFTIEGENGRDPALYRPSALSRPIKIYNNTFIFLGDHQAPVIATRQTRTFTTASVAYSFSYTGDFIVENNVLHTPFATSGAADAGPFTLTPLFTSREKGYFDALPGMDPVYALRCFAPSSGERVMPQVGEVLTGQTTGAVRTVSEVGVLPPTTVSGGVAADWIRLEHTVEAGPATNVFRGWWAGGGELVLGNGSPQARFNTGGSDRSANDFRWDTALIPKTVTPTHVLAYDNQTANFTEGETLTGPSGTAYICRVFDIGATGWLWLRDVTGTFTDNQTITDGEGGSAQVNGALAISGCGAFWVQNTIANCGAATVAAATDFFGELRPPLITDRHVGAFEGAI